MWWVENGSGVEHLLAVRRRIFVGLEEGKGKAADKSGSEIRIAGDLKKVFQEGESGCLHGREHAHPLFFLPPEKGKPEVKLFLGNLEALTEPFYGSKAQEILCKDAEDEEKTVGGIRDDEIREDGMGMTAGTDKAQDAEAVPDVSASHEINQGTVIIGMDGAGALHPAAGAGL